MAKKNKTKIIFLDIDGVLAGYDYLVKERSFIDKEKIQLTNQLEGAEIVISSSWGYDNGNTEKTLRQCGLTLPIIGYTEHFYAIIDDDCDMLLGQAKNFVRIDRLTGITEKDIQKIKKILKLK